MERRRQAGSLGLGEALASRGRAGPSEEEDAVNAPVASLVLLAHRDEQEEQKQGTTEAGDLVRSGGCADPARTARTKARKGIERARSTRQEGRVFSLVRMQKQGRQRTMQRLDGGLAKRVAEWSRRQGGGRGRALEAASGGCLSVPGISGGLRWHHGIRCSGGRWQEARRQRRQEREGGKRWSGVGAPSFLQDSDEAPARLLFPAAEVRERERGVEEESSNEDRVGRGGAELLCWSGAPASGD